MKVRWDSVGHTRRGSQWSQSLKRHPNMLFMTLFVKKAHVGAIGFLKDNTSCKILWSQESRPEHHPGAQVLSL